ncbi:type II CRISPR RNA-guided endonuclease Cas9 [Chitinophaga japonensis]|uniref:CRISPR-associated endonuclease Cas9 n=1 Tax=Chitinophaga japonensis TaxID=104662 RepID=A0A562TB31_CHIJA|nr:type II CRISPR RNA-guided endonuclease Cas9 [Chitinophaga japonensis]TWI90785.1 CRISPR-associated endonuclease Csn1 [Chitinophaga japonensis]
MKRILGLDIGSNSIGWAVVNLDFDNEQGEILGAGSRIVPMDADLLTNFEQGNSVSKTAARRQARGARRLRHRYKLRRQRLIELLKLLGWLPATFEPGHKLPITEDSIKQMYELFATSKIPEDWIVYFLRHKALTRKIALSELARVLYHINQRRGFKSNRKANNEAIENTGEDSEDSLPKRESKVMIVKVTGIRDTGEITRKKKAIEIEVDQPVSKGITKGIIYRDTLPDWLNQEIELEVRVIRSKKDTRVEFAIPDKTDWQKLREALAKDFDNKNLHPGSYFLHEILKDRNYRIRERIIDRARYEAEFKAIWEKQSEYHPELKAMDKLPEIAQKFYANNKEKQKELLSNDLFYIIVKDIIYYQRPLKSQKSSIGECRYEKKNVVLDKQINGKTIPYTPGYKVAPISSPAFQEFRIWKTLLNLKIFALKKMINERWETDIDETEIYIRPKLEPLFNLFDSKAKVSSQEIFKLIGVSNNTHRLNYPPETEFPGNETKQEFRKLFKKHNYASEGNELLENEKKLQQLWHLIYSVDDENAIKRSLEKRFEFPDTLAAAFSKLPPFRPQYASYSAKAIHKLLSLMRAGKYWSESNIPLAVRERISKLDNGELDTTLDESVRERVEKFRAKHGLSSITDYQALPEWLACYIVYGKHSENNYGEPCSTPEEVKGLEAKTLRNPIVEQVVNETLQLVKDIWRQYGRPEQIRVELARNLKKTAAERKAIYDANRQNREDKERIKAILRELKIGNPDSLADIEKVRILEENGNFKYQNSRERFFRKATEPTQAEVEKYRLWVEQKCISPYTGNPIMLSELFTFKYEVDHVIPRSRHYDDSLANKVIVESWANKEKDNLTAMQYIQQGSIQNRLLPVEKYLLHIEENFRGRKRRNLLSAEVPKGFIERQLNDTRHISRRVNELLHQVTGQVWASSGQITDELKHKWGLGNKMKEILEERFLRLESITGETMVSYTVDENGQRNIHLQGYEKRIDHRHHAMDAIVVACTTQSHIQYINTLEAQNTDKDKGTSFRKKLLQSNKARDFRKPWKTFVEDAKTALESTIISYKNRHRILNKGINRYTKYVRDEKGEWIKALVEQTKGELFSARKPLHKETIGGTVNFREYRKANLEEALKDIDKVADKSVKRQLKALKQEYGNDIKKIKSAIKANPLTDTSGNITDKVLVWHWQVYALNRVALDASFKKDKIDKIAEYDNKKQKGLKYQLHKHLSQYEDDPKAAFTGEGLEALAKTVGKPVTKVSIYEPVGGKFEIRPGQLVEAAKGTNLFFVIYENILTGERSYTTLGLREVLTAKMNKLPVVPPKEGHKHYVLSPNDLVYVPDTEENIKAIDWSNKKAISSKIYKMVSSSGNQCFFVPHHISKPIIETLELGANNKSERSWDGKMIKQCCIKLRHDRLGNIAPA